MQTLVFLASFFAAAAQSAEPPATFKQYCYQCHGKSKPAGGVSLEALGANPAFNESFQQWNKIAAALEEKRMPPKNLPQPPEAERQAAVRWVRSALHDYAARHEGDPGRVTVRRLTSGEYAYAVRDLTGLDLDLSNGFVSDEVGGEGFTNFGDVQFVQESAMERYLETAKYIADRAVIGSGPLEFFPDAGKTGFELSAISRIREIYEKNGFRTVSGEGGKPFGLDRYGKAFFAAWRYRHRAALKEPTVTLTQLARREGINAAFVEHISAVVNTKTLGYPSAEIAARWNKLPGPDQPEVAVRAACAELQKFSVTWPSWLFARGDVAAGGAGDERPLEFSDASLKVMPARKFTFLRGLRLRGSELPTGGTATIYLNAVLANPTRNVKPAVLWREASVRFRKPGDVRQRRTDNSAARVPLKDVLTEASIAKLKPDEAGTFASEGSISFDVKVPDGISVFDLQVEAGLGADRDQVLRVTISDRADGGTRGVPVWGLVGDPQSAGYREFKAGVFEFARILPPNSHGEPTPADKDPIPEPFDNTYNVPEHDEFVVKVKYIRDDRFVVEKILDPATRARLDHAWNDLYASFEYHDAYLDLLAKHFKHDLKGKGAVETKLEELPAEMQKYARPLKPAYDQVMAAQTAGQRKHLDDCLEFASRAWRRPLSDVERQKLRSFYAAARKESELDHRGAIRAVIARVLVSPAFLYRMEQTGELLSQPELATRLSFFLWSSIPDEELRRADLSTPRQIERQVRRMLADPRARRFSTEFFGQWLGFYRFDQYRGVDTSRFPEFTSEVKSAMYDEAVTFFEHLVRQNRPVNEILNADYTFLNKALAKHYGAGQEAASKETVELVRGADHRGGLLRLGAVLTATSAPLRTSPVKRGDWLLRRILGTPTPPPPADAGSIPADEKQFGGLSLAEKLKAHQRNATCAGCHTRIDPMGFPLERYDAVGRWRDTYSDGKPVDDKTEMAGAEVLGVDGLLRYLDSRQDQVRHTMSNKLLGYALGRTVQLSDQPLIERMVAAGGNATFADLAVQIAASRQFRHRQPAAGALKPVARNFDKMGRPQ